MWTDPLDELINDLERALPPRETEYGGGQDALTTLQLWAARLLQRADESYPEGPDPDDPEVQEAREHIDRAMCQLLGRPADWTPPKQPSSDTRRRRPARRSRDNGSGRAAPGRP